MISKTEEQEMYEDEMRARGKLPGPPPDPIPGVENIGRPSLDNVREALRKFEDITTEALVEGHRREEAIRNEREVQERARAYRQVEHGSPTSCPHCGGALTLPLFEVG